VPEITDEYMNAMLPTTREYTAVVLKAGPQISQPGVEKVIWEHGRRNFALRADGLLAIVCPVTDGSGVTGVAVFDASPEKTRELMDDDPGVRAGVFTYEVHPCRSFPGDRLPG
jgi:hypothetical protein